MYPTMLLLDCRKDDDNNVYQSLAKHKPTVWFFYLYRDVGGMGGIGWGGVAWVVVVGVFVDRVLGRGCRWWLGSKDVAAEGLLAMLPRSRDNGYRLLRRCEQGVAIPSQQVIK